MTQDRVRRLARLVEIQRLVKMEHEMRLAAIGDEIAALGADETALRELQDRHYEGAGSFIPMNTIVTRLDSIQRRVAVLEAQAASERHMLLRANRTFERVDDRHATEKRSLERTESAKALEEALPYMLARSRTSLP